MEAGGVRCPAARESGSETGRSLLSLAELGGGGVAYIFSSALGSVHSKGCWDIEIWAIFYILGWGEGGGPWSFGDFPH